MTLDAWIGGLAWQSGLWIYFSQTLICIVDLRLFLLGLTLDKFGMNVNFKTPFGCVLLMFTLSRSIMTCVGYQSP